MTLVDTNYVIRWFLEDIPEQAKVARRLFERAPASSLHLDRLILAEITFVLRSYGYNHGNIAEIIYEISRFDAVAPLSPQEHAALSIYATTSLDYEDCFLIAEALKQENSGIDTFDKKLLKTFEKLQLAE